MGTFPGSLSEGVSSDGCLGPMVYPQLFIGSETFERLRSPKYTPSVSHSLDSSLREGAGGERPIPAPSLRELARPTGVTEGVSSDGSTMPTIYTPVHINSEIFERLRSSKYTPSVSHSLDSSLREGAGNGGAVPFIAPPGSREWAGDFHRPYESSENFYILPFNVPVGAASSIPAPWSASMASPMASYVTGAIISVDGAAQT